MPGLLGTIPRISWLRSKVFVKKSPIHGLGLFSAEMVKTDERVMVLGGETVTNKQVEERMRSGERYDGVVLDSETSLSILPRDWPGSYGNHSYNPKVLSSLTRVLSKAVKSNKGVID